MKKIVRVSVALCALPFFGNLARADGDQTGFSLTVEGAISEHFEQATQSGDYAPVAADQPWKIGEAKIQNLFGGRIEGLWQFETSGGQSYRVGLLAAGWDGGDSKQLQDFGTVFYKPEPDGSTEGEIRICDTTTCNTVGYTENRQYGEIVPELWTKVDETAGQPLWLGVEPFVGAVRENAFSSVLNSGNTSIVSDSLRGQAYGAMLTGEKDFYGVLDNTRLFVVAAVGAYTFHAGSRVVGGELGSEDELQNRSSVSGFRGQLGVGSDVTITSHVSLGLTARLDYWSDQPYQSGPFGVWDPQPPCTRNSNQVLVCVPPKTVGSYKILGDQVADMSVGASLTYRFDSAADAPAH
jgi:hypothetical protein